MDYVIILSRHAMGTGRLVAESGDSESVRVVKGILNAEDLSMATKKILAEENKGRTSTFWKVDQIVPVPAS